MENDINCEIREMMDSGMTKISSDCLIRELASLGYEIDPAMTFNYINNGNKNKYKAKSCGIRQADNKQSAFHWQARRDANFDALQKFRLNTFCVDNCRIWEI